MRRSLPSRCRLGISCKRRWFHGEQHHWFFLEKKRKREGAVLVTFLSVWGYLLWPCNMPQLPAVKPSCYINPRAVLNEKISRSTFGRKKGTPWRSRGKKFWRSFLIRADFMPLIPNWGVVLKVRSLTEKMPSRPPCLPLVHQPGLSTDQPDLWLIGGQGGIYMYMCIYIYALIHTPPRGQTKKKKKKEVVKQAGIFYTQIWEKSCGLTRGQTKICGPTRGQSLDQA